MWLSQVLWNGDWTLLAPGDARHWRMDDDCDAGYEKRSGGGRKPPSILEVDSRATPGCVRSGDVMAMRHGSEGMRLREVRRCTAEAVELVRLQHRRNLRASAVKGEGSL